MDKKTLNKLTTTVKQILQLKGLAAAQEEQIEGLKKIVTDISEAHLDDFTDGVLKLEAGVIKTAWNKPKLVGLDDTEITPLRMTQLVSKLEDQFRKETINIAMLRDYAEAGDKQVLKVLTKLGVKVIREVRYDVKAL